MKRMLVALVILICCLPLQSAQVRKKTQSHQLTVISEKEALAAQGLTELYTTAQQRSFLNTSPLLRSLQALLAKNSKSTQLTTAITMKPFTL